MVQGILSYHSPKHRIGENQGTFHLQLDPNQDQGILFQQVQSWTEDHNEINTLQFFPDSVLCVQKDGWIKNLQVKRTRHVHQISK